MTNLPATRALGAMLILFAAGPALAQEDPIGALLDKTVPVQPAPAAPEAAPPAPQPQPPAPQQPAPRTDAPQAPLPQPAPPPLAPTEQVITSHPERGAQPSIPLAPLPQTTYRPAPPPYIPPAPRPQTSGRPVQIDESGRTPDGPPTANDRAYEARMRASFAASQGLQGPLDGRWTIRAGGTELYELQLVDKSSGVLEGAWRDPRRKGAADAAGFVDEMTREGARLIVRFHPRAGTDAVVVTLTESGYGAWSGELVEKGERRAVSMKRD